MTSVAEKTPSEQLQDLTNTLYLINGLHTKIAQEIKLMATTASQMTVATSGFQECLGILEAETHQLIPTLQNESRTMAQKIGQEAGQHFVKTSTEQVEKILSKLQTKTTAIENNLEECHKKINFFSRTTIILVLVSTLIGSLIGGGLVHYLFPPLDAKTAAQLRYGESLLNNWMKLDKKDRDKLVILLPSSPNK